LFRQHSLPYTSGSKRRVARRIRSQDPDCRSARPPLHIRSFQLGKLYWMDRRSTCPRFAVRRSRVLRPDQATGIHSRRHCRHRCNHRRCDRVLTPRPIHRFAVTAPRSASRRPERHRRLHRGNPAQRHDRTAVSAWRRAYYDNQQPLDSTTVTAPRCNRPTTSSPLPIWPTATTSFNGRPPMMGAGQALPIFNGLLSLKNGAWQPVDQYDTGNSFTFTAAAGVYSQFLSSSATTPARGSGALGRFLFRITTRRSTWARCASSQPTTTLAPRANPTQPSSTHFSFERSRVCRSGPDVKSAGFFTSAEAVQSRRVRQRVADSGADISPLGNPRSRRMDSSFTSRVSGPEQHLALQQGWRQCGKYRAAGDAFRADLRPGIRSPWPALGNDRRRSAGPARPQYRRHNRELQRWHRTGSGCRSELGYPLRLNRKRHRTVQYGDACVPAVLHQRVNGLAYGSKWHIWGATWPQDGQIVTFDKHGIATAVISLSGPTNGLAFGQPNTPLAGLLFATQRDGTLTMIDLATDQTITVASAASAGILRTSVRDGRLYITQSDRSTCSSRLSRRMYWRDPGNSAQLRRSSAPRPSRSTAACCQRDRELGDQSRELSSFAIPIPARFFRSAPSPTTRTPILLNSGFESLLPEITT